MLCLLRVRFWGLSLLPWRLVARGANVRWDPLHSRSGDDDDEEEGRERGDAFEGKISRRIRVFPLRDFGAREEGEDYGLVVYWVRNARIDLREIIRENVQVRR